MAFGSSGEVVAATFVAKDQVTPVVNKMRQSVQGAMGSIKQGIGVGFGIGTVGLIRDAVGAVTDFAQSSIEAASNLNETVSKSGVIFGDSEGSMEAWAKTAASSFGQSERAALDAASTFGGLFQGVGDGIDASAQKAKKLTQLGSDLASFFNTDVATALDSLRSGLSGESEPLRKYNIFLSETAVNNYLLAQGIKKVNGQYTEAQKIQARYALILQASTAAQGDFARTSDGLANSQRTLDAEMENAQAQLGQNLLPAQLAATQAQIDFTNALGDTFALLDSHGHTVTEQVTATRDFFDSVKTLFPQLGIVTDKVDQLTQSYVQSTEQTDELARHTHILTQSFNEIAPDIAAHAAAVKAASKNVFAGINQAWQAEKDVWERDAKDLPGDIATAINSTKGDVKSEMRTLMDLINHPLKRERAIARIEGALTGSNLAEGLNSKDPAIRAWATGVQADLIAKWERLTGVAYNKGAAVGNSFESGLGKAMPGTITLHVRAMPAVQKRAAGGPVSAGQTYLVGERGPEVLHMGSQNGYIQPNGGGMGGNVYLDGRLVGRIMDERLGRELATSSSYSWTRG